MNDTVLGTSRSIRAAALMNLMASPRLQALLQMQLAEALSQLDRTFPVSQFQPDADWSGLGQLVGDPENFAQSGPHSILGTFTAGDLGEITGSRFGTEPDDDFDAEGHLPTPGDIIQRYFGDLPGHGINVPGDEASEGFGAAVMVAGHVIYGFIKGGLLGAAEELGKAAVEIGGAGLIDSVIEIEKVPDGPDAGIPGPPPVDAGVPQPMGGDPAKTPNPDDAGSSAPPALGGPLGQLFNKFWRESYRVPHPAIDNILDDSFDGTSVLRTSRQAVDPSPDQSGYDDANVLRAIFSTSAGVTDPTPDGTAASRVQGAG